MTLAHCEPLLTTERLELWRPQASDLADLYALTLHDDTRRYLGGTAPSEADSASRLLRNAGSWSLYGYGVFMVRRRGEAQIVGSCGVFQSWRGVGQGMDDTPEAGWIIHPDYCGQGLAGEAMRAVLPWFDAVHGPRRVACMIEEGHTVSERLAGVLGFVRYGGVHSEGEKPLGLYERGYGIAPLTQPD